jgi:uncharacterized protein
MTRERTISLLVVLIFICGLVFYALRRIESSLTFHPEKNSSNSIWTAPLNSEEVWIKTSDNLKLHGWFIKAATQPSKATIIYFHGNGGNISYLTWLANQLSSKGMDLLLFDYRGYGKSEGEVAGERELNVDGDAAYNYIVYERRVDPSNIVLYGQSLGTTVAVDIASRRGSSALILESGLSSAADMASQALPWLPKPLYLLGRNRFYSVTKIKKVRVPVLITHGEDDPVIPVEQSQKLYEAANEPKKRVLYAGVGHNVQGMLGSKYIEEISKFIKDSRKREF